MGKKDQFVLDGASIKCALGDKSAKLNVTSNFRTYTKGKKIATGKDNKIINVVPPVATFGTCKPYKAVPPPGCLCTFIPNLPWFKVYLKKKVVGNRPLTGDSFYMCPRGMGLGMVTIKGTKQQKHTNLPTVLRCPVCNKFFNSKEHKHESIPLGEYNGSGIELGDHILFKVFGCEGEKKPFYLHPFFYKYEWKHGNNKQKAEIRASGNRYGIQAHHLICSDALSGDINILHKVIFFGYSVNHHKNGVLLPSIMKVACYFKVPLHRGSHDSALLLKNDKIINNKNLENVEVDFPIFNPGQELAEITYARKVKTLVADIMSSVNLDNVCDSEKRKKQAEDLINDMDAQSEEIWIKVKKFKWTISADGFDYQSGGIGCLRQNRLPEKRNILKKKFNIKADNVEDIARELYTNKDKWKDITFCDRDHKKNYINEERTNREIFEERKAEHLKEKKFND